jgi:hypothetical protein
VQSIVVVPPVVMKWMALRSGVRWPRNLKTVPQLKRAIAEHPDNDRFDELVEDAVGKMEALSRGPKFSPTHPMFGPMTAGDWMRWGYLHADHHLRQFGR